MTWINRYRIRRYLIDRIWVGPCAGIVAGMLTARLGGALDTALGCRMDLNADAVGTVLVTLASSMFTFVVFVSSALLIALQLASTQLTPRILALVFRDPVTKWSMTLFVFTFALTLGVVLRLTPQGPLLTVYLSVGVCIASLAVFLYLIDHIARLLRPANALRLVARRGREVIESVYPLRFTGPAAAAAAAEHDTTGGLTGEISEGCAEGPRVIAESKKDGVILACDFKEIVEQARRAGCVLEMVPQVGDFIAKGDPLFRLARGASAPPEATLRRLVAVGHERSLEQDPAFAFRIIVDIACKALSPAINDPTTAVLAIDQLQHLLGVVGRRHLDEGRALDRAGAPRLLYRTPGWEDFVHLAIVEVRQYGNQSIQVSRRLSAMIEGLLRVLPAARAPALRDELEALRRSALRYFLEPRDQVMAVDSDRQGVGGRHAPDQKSTAPAPQNGSTPQIREVVAYEGNKATAHPLGAIEQKP